MDLDLAESAAPDPFRDERRPEWQRLLFAQSGVVGFRQLRQLGVTESSIIAQVAAGRWQHPVHGVYVTFTGPLPRSARISVARIYGGPAAVLSHRTAAEEWRLVPIEDGPVHITVPYGASAVSQPGLITVHRSRAYRHIVVAADPPRTSRADTAIDLAVEEPDAPGATAGWSDGPMRELPALIEVVREKRRYDDVSRARATVGCLRLRRRSGFG